MQHINYYSFPKKTKQRKRIFFIHFNQFHYLSYPEAVADDGILVLAKRKRLGEDKFSNPSDLIMQFIGNMNRMF